MIPNITTGKDQEEILEVFMPEFSTASSQAKKYFVYKCGNKLYFQRYSEKMEYHTSVLTTSRTHKYLCREYYKALEHKDLKALQSMRDLQKESI